MKSFVLDAGSERVAGQRAPVACMYEEAVPQAFRPVPRARSGASVRSRKCQCVVYERARVVRMRYENAEWKQAASDAAMLQGAKGERVRGVSWRRSRDKRFVGGGSTRGGCLDGGRGKWGLGGDSRGQIRQRSRIFLVEFVRRDGEGSERKAVGDKQCRWRRMRMRIEGEGEGEE